MIDVIGFYDSCISSDVRCVVTQKCYFNLYVRFLFWPSGTMMPSVSISARISFVLVGSKSRKYAGNSFVISYSYPNISSPAVVGS